jgi:hypothetical protein
MKANRRLAQNAMLPVPRKLELVPIRDLIPAPENEKLYRPVRKDDPEVIALANSIRTNGIQQPLVVTLDYFILSGHRRHKAADLAGLSKIPCLFEDFRHDEDPDRFVRLLAEHNRQRIKNVAELAHEAALEMDPDAAYALLEEERRCESRIKVAPMELLAKKRRSTITEAKEPFLKAITKILHEYKEYLPLSERQIHYYLLNDPPLKHASKPDSVYKNDKISAQALSELCTRARIVGLIPDDAISDETRPETLWRCYSSASAFLRVELQDFLKGYWRDPLQSQPHHIELLVEKNTIARAFP